jgi:hypothetical protein
MTLFIIQKQDGTLEGPSIWTRRMATACGIAYSSNPPSVPFTTASGHVLREYVLNEATTLDYQTVTEDDGSVEDGRFVVTQTAIDIPIEAAKDAALAALAQKRWEIETGGITINGRFVDTSDRSKTLIIGKSIKAKENDDLTFQWKVGSGFVTIDSATMISIADAVEAHVQGAFDREAELSSDILDATTTAEVRAVNINSGWN